MRGGPDHRWRYRLLGGLTVDSDDRGAPDLGGRKQRAVLAALLLEHDRAVPADRLIEQVWGDGAPPRAAAGLQAYVSKLRRQLEPDGTNGTPHVVLVTEPGGYRLAVERDAVDLARFDDLQLAGAAALAAGDHAAAAERFEEALLLHGPLLPELAGEPWVAEAAARVEAAHADIVDGAFEAKLALGAGREVVGPIEAAVASHPFRERLRGHLALALYRAGRQTDALRSLADARRTLADEIGVDPGPELRQLEADILVHAPHLDPPPRPTTGPTRPASTAPARGTMSSEQIPASPGRTLPATRAGTVVDPAAGATPRGGVELIGRSTELGWLLDAARQAAGGAGRAVVVSGEPGIGKTRLAEEVVAAVADGFVVAWARCHERAASAPYWAYTQIAEQVLEAGVVSVDARDGISAAGGGVHTIDPAADRPTLHTTMLAALRSTDRPLLLVADDLQWADASSLRVLEFVTSALATVPVLLVATVRPAGPGAPPALVDCLAELARQPDTLRIDLHGLSTDDVGTWLFRRGDVPAADDVVRLVHDRTGGNPFFVGEVVELLARQDRLRDADAARRAGVPAAALDVVRRRVGMLPGETQQLLATASVLGITIELDVLARVAGISPVDTLDALDPAVEAGLLAEDPSGPARLRFAHALVADALAAELSPSRRARLHAAVVAALEDLRSADIEPHLAALAHHGRSGAAAGVAPQALDYASRAARAAVTHGAFEVAAGYWDDARSLLDLARPGDRQARYEVLLELGQTRLAADDVLNARQALLDAVSTADAMGDAPAMRRAAAALATTTLWQASPYGEVHAPVVDALERAIAAAEKDTPVAERAGLLGALADAVYYDPDPGRSQDLAAEAVHLARRADDPNTVALALSQRFRSLWRGSLLPEQEAIATELVELARARRLRPGLAAVAHLTGAILAFSRADRTAYETHLAEGRVHADESSMPALLSQVGWAEASWLVTLGRYDEAAALARETDRLYRRARGWQADDIYTSYVLAIGHDRGTLADPLAAAGDLLDGDLAAGVREVVGWMLVENGDLTRARQVVGPAGSAPDLPPDWLWAESVTAAAHVRAALGDRPACAALRQRLAPMAGRLDVTAGPFLGGVDLALARLADALGDGPGARRHAADAVATLEAFGARPALARALLCQGQLLATADAAADRAAADAVLLRAGRIADEVGLAPVRAALDGMQAGSKVATG